MYDEVDDFIAMCNEPLAPEERAKVVAEYNRKRLAESDNEPNYEYLYELKYGYPYDPIPGINRF